MTVPARGLRRCAVLCAASVALLVGAGVGEASAAPNSAPLGSTLREHYPEFWDPDPWDPWYVPGDYGDWDLMPAPLLPPLCTGSVC